MKRAFPSLDPRSQINYIEQTKRIVLRRVKDKNISVFLFGSRAKGNHARHADVDIGFISEDKIDTRLLRKISDDLEESRVPFHVDLVDFSKVHDRFKKAAMKGIVWWQKAN